MESITKETPQSRAVELYTGDEAHPETADVLLMPNNAMHNQVLRNEIGTEVRVATGLQMTDENKKSWLIGYLSSDITEETIENDQFELARAFICNEEDDPNGFYSKEIYDLLSQKASEGHIASEITDFLEEKVKIARNNLASLKYESLK